MANSIIEKSLARDVNTLNRQLPNKSDRLINDYIGNSATRNYQLESNRSYLIVISWIGGGSVLGTAFGVMTSASNDGATSRITWIDSHLPENASITFSFSGLTLTVTVGSGTWADLAITKI